MTHLVRINLSKNSTKQWIDNEAYTSVCAGPPSVDPKVIYMSRKAAILSVILGRK